MLVLGILASKDRKLISASPDTTVAEIVKMLHGNNVGAVLIMRGKELLGVLSERGIVRAMALNPQGVRAMAASAAMRPLECHISPDAAIEDAMEMMTRYRVRYLPVMEGGDLIGLISIGDVVKAQLGTRATEVESLTSYIAGA